MTGMSEAEAWAHVGAAEDIWLKRSARVWHLDLSMLTGAGVSVRRPAAAADRPAVADRALRQERPATEPEGSRPTLASTSQSASDQAGAPVFPRSRPTVGHATGMAAFDSRQDDRDRGLGQLYTANIRSAAPASRPAGPVRDRLRRRRRHYLPHRKAWPASLSLRLLPPCSVVNRSGRCRRAGRPGHIQRGRCRRRPTAGTGRGGCRNTGAAPRPARELRICPRREDLPAPAACGDRKPRADPAIARIRWCGCARRDCSRMATLQRGWSKASLLQRQDR